jgi:hypothetical protein
MAFRNNEIEIFIMKFLMNKNEFLNYIIIFLKE